MRVGKNKQGSPQNLFCEVEKGYTIIEVLMFLAISSFMFVVAAVAINGKQANAEFRQGMNATNDQIRQVINDVSNGYFPSNSNFMCSAGASGSPTISPGSVNQGNNLGCVFTGKVVRFSLNTNSYVVFSLAGRQFIGSSFTSGVPTNLAEAQPTDVYNLRPPAYVFKSGLQLTKVIDSSGAIGAIAFIKSFPSLSQSGDINSGSQDVDIIPITSSGGKTNNIDTITAYLRSPSTPPAPPNVSVNMCFSDGGSKYGSITIGGSSGQRSATKVNFGNTPVKVGC